MLLEKNIKMIVTDLDGTLLRTDKTISARAKAALIQCRGSGIKVAFATGRGSSLIQVAPYELFDGRITQNGAVTVAGEKITRTYYIPFEVARPILIELDRHGLKATSEDRAMHYSNFTLTDVWPPITNFEVVDFSKHNIDAEKINIIIRNRDDIEYIRSILPLNLYLTVSNDGIGQVMHIDATKAKAVDGLARMWGIPQSDIAAFGDDLNDIDMLKYAGAGVAMGNALEEVKMAADCICGANDDDGVAKWIEENIML